jgi:membrane protein DedA with SNARE-associated domain
MSRNDFPSVGKNESRSFNTRTNRFSSSSEVIFFEYTSFCFKLNILVQDLLLEPYSREPAHATSSDSFSNLTGKIVATVIMFFLVDWFNWIAALFSDNPLLLVFVLGLVGNILPFVPTPSLLLVVLLVINPGSPFQGVGIIEIASITALGACIGKLASYALGYGARRAIGRPERFDSLRKYLGGSTFLVGLVFAASPLVDTAVIPLGMIRYSLPKTLVSLYAGKFIWILSVLFFSRQLGASLAQSLGQGTYTSLLSIALLVPIAYFLVSVDWEHRLLGRKDTLRNRILARIRSYFGKQESSTSASETVATS